MNPHTLFEILCLCIAALFFLFAGLNITRNPPSQIQYIPMGYFFITLWAIIFIYHNML